MILIVVQGGSATGKTTLARRLANDFGAFLLSKDNFKEMLYDTLGIPERRDISTMYGLAATKSLYAAADTFLGAGKNIVMESAYNKHLAMADISELVSGKEVKLFQVYVTASPEVRVRRYNERIQKGERHKGHPDNVGGATVEVFARDDEKYGKLAIDNTVEINTDNFTPENYETLMQTLRKLIGE